MQAADFFAGVNNLMRSWGYPVEERSGCWSRGNGSSWPTGMPEAHTNHHFVIKLSSPFENGASNVANGDATLSGPKSNYYGGIDQATGRQRLQFIAVKPTNHAGQGRSETYQRMTSGRAPLGWVATSYSPVKDNWGDGNRRYAGTEWHHPGDSTPWSPLFIDLVVALNTAMCIVASWGPERCHQHAEHSARKIDMSYLTRQGGFDIRARVADRMSGKTPTQPPSGPGLHPWWAWRRHWS